MNIIYLYRGALALVLLLNISGAAEAASTDRTALYGLTTEGVLLSISTSTGATTVVRQLPFTSGVSQEYSNLAVYKGTFLTVQGEDFIAFGLQAGDQVRLARAIDTSQANSAEYPSTGLPRGWDQYFLSGGGVANVIHENDPINGTSTQLLSNSVIYPLTSYPCTNYSPPAYTTCSNDVLESSFAGNNTSYFTHSCNECGGYSGRFTLLIRADLQSGTWVKTMEVAADTGAFAADPATDGILWASEAINSGGGLTKMNVNTSPITYTWFYPTLLGNSTPIIGMAFGPPSSDVLSPKDVSDLTPFTEMKPWTPMAMLFGQQ